MPLQNESLTIADLVRPLSLEAIQYFASNDIPVVKEHDTSRYGKFIRIGEVMLIGSIIDYGKPNGHGTYKDIKHVDILTYLIEHAPELYREARKTPANELTPKNPLSDAGYTWIGVDADNNPTSLRLSQDSYDYGRAKEAGRQASIEIAQKLVGDSIVVTGE